MNTLKLRKFFQEYNKTVDLMVKLDSIYDFIFKSKDRKSDILILLKVFNHKKYDINEIKTVLILSASFIDDEIVEAKIKLSKRLKE